MADYLTSFRAGLDAYNDAVRARKEIAEVFEEFARAVHDASSGHVVVEQQRAGRTTVQVMRDAQKTVDPYPLEPQPEEIFVLTATGHDEQQPAYLCHYSLGERGYPVKLVYGREIVRCHDREGLEKGLQDLLEYPETGGKLRRLMDNDRPSENDVAPTP
jgi:hypothetical protein